MNVLSHQKQQEISILLRSGRHSLREIARLLGIDRETVRRYAKELREADLSKITNTLAEVQNQPEVSTGPEGKTSHPCRPALPTASSCEAHREWIEGEVRRGRNAMAIYQELVDTKGFQNKYTSVMRFVRTLKVKEPEIFDVLEFLPGEEAQVDYGMGAPTRHPETGKMKRPRLFVMTLRYSRRAFRKVVWKSSSEVWARLHEDAFRYFGGVTQFVVLDNLKEGVIKPSHVDPQINRLYGEVLNFYGAIADPCRVNDPNRKGTVECAIKHTQSTALHGRKFESIEEQNEFLMHWEERWAAPRIHGSTKRQVNAMFEEEKPALKPLPLERFRFFKEEKRSVDDAATVIADKVRYSARPALPRTEVAIRIYENEIEIRDAVTNAFIRKHERTNIPGSVVMNPEDRIFNPSRNTTYGLMMAEKIGSNTLRVCESIFAKDGRIAHKSIFAIVTLAKKHGNELVEEAARLCVGREQFSYAGIKNRLNNLLVGAQFAKQLPQKSALIQESKLIRPASEYAKFFKHIASHQEQPHDDELN